MDSSTLAVWHEILEEPPEVPVFQTRTVYSVNSASAAVLGQLKGGQRIGRPGICYSRGWDESLDRRRGFLEVGWGRPGSWREVILQGPHIYVSQPMFKSPNSTMKHNQDWSRVDLEVLGPNEIPVTAFMPDGSRGAYDAAYDRWGQSGSARDFYRVAWRRMAANASERTLASAIIPPGAAHVNTVRSLGCPDDDMDTVLIAGFLSSLVSDFLVRSAPKNDIIEATIARLPIDRTFVLNHEIVLRVLRLNCVTADYGRLWHTILDPLRASVSTWAGGLDYPGRPLVDEIGPEWSERAPLRRDSDRRQAQVEIDALVALSLGLSADQLCTLYRAEFDVLVKNDRRNVYFDRVGRAVPAPVLQVSKRKGLSQDDTEGLTLEERTHTHPGSGVDYVYELPFRTLDREADMRTAYAHFERVLAERGG